MKEKEKGNTECDMVPNCKENCLDKYYRQRVEIINHIRSGGSIDDLDTEEYGFVLPL